MPTKQELTAKQQEILEAVQTWISEHGRPPTLREMAIRMGVASTNAIRDHLRVLENKGYLKREARLSRGLEVIRGGKSDEPAVATEHRREVVGIPLIGRVAAGLPILAEENIEDTI